MNVILLPGMDGTGALFEPLLERLPQGCARVVSYAPDTPPRWEAYAKQVGEQADTSAEFVLFAESFSGPIALRFLEHAGGNCRGFVACATFLSDPAPLASSLAAIPGSWLAVPSRPPRWALRRLLLSGDPDEALLKRVHEAVVRVPVKALVHRLRLLRRLRPRDCEFAFPVCYLRALGDALVAPRLGAEFVARVQDAWLEEIEGPHLLAQANPEAVAKRILAVAGG